MKYIVDIKGEIEGDYEIIGKYEERPHGKWIWQTDFDGFTYWKCSNCNKKNEMHLFDFCPNCGAKMGGNSGGI